MYNKYTKDLILIFLLFISFSFIYFIWNFKIRNHFPIAQSFSYLIKDPVYILSLFRLIFEILSVSLIILSVNIYSEIHLNFKKIFSCVIIAEFVFLVQAFYEFTWLLISKTNEDLTNFTTFSLYNLKVLKGLPNYYNFALKTINLWELLYIITLIICLKKNSNNSLRSIFWIIFPTYCLALILYIIFVTFIQISNA